MFSHLTVHGIYGIVVGAPLGSPIDLPPFNSGLSLLLYTITGQGGLPVAGANRVFPFRISASLAGAAFHMQALALTLFPLGGSFTIVLSFSIAP